MFKYVLAAIMAIGVLSIGGRVATQALFTDTQSVAANTFTAGTIDIASSPASALLSLSAMAPGGEVNSPITITNSGTLQLRYAVQRLADDTDSKGLRDELRLRVSTKAGAGCDFPYYSSNGTVTTHSDDVQLYEGLNFPATAADTVGSAVQGSQAGDRVLNASASEDLCFAVVMPSSVGNAHQGATTSATFDFISEQTANN
jgi:hypothetical protein